ncbi:tripartite tricarboxylate transporter TctB family protein [Bradyrhizobium sp. NP1]|uniref:tripartite tricarboxylate transporter TctB family protein n=1 Tax=Bradyrhizobium sp. NP1 TaxID=3049772 RepID=UPI0025A56C12|nr:tripartite tricarboxylate transporter TctB family protein [Bradyrhizobium sp. NP1]WJR75859.1 tripartite tricarboxylate transporter TctB family protein [Bradyrhizobium sp. NP1]
MDLSSKYRGVLPYLVVLGIAIWLFYAACNIAYTPLPDQMGPDRWPKMITAILAFVSAFEIVRRLVASAPVQIAAGEDKLNEDLLHAKQTHIPMVLGTIIVTVVYLLALERCGFALSTALYSSCLMWLGGFRKPLVIMICACALTVFFTFVFMKLIFVALPLGQGPFENISLAIMRLVGVH